MADTMTPTAGMSRNARRALEVRASKPASQRGMTPVGVRRATQLKNREPISLQTGKRILLYLARHLKDKQGDTWGEKGKGWQAWHGWGGDAGRTWAEKIIRQVEGGDDD